MRVCRAVPLRRPVALLAAAGFVLAAHAPLRAADGVTGAVPAADGRTRLSAARGEANASAGADGGSSSVASRSSSDDGGASRVERARPPEPDSTVATMQCAHVAAAPARVRCAVEVRVGDGESIGWGDAVLVTMPPFVEALRGRLGPHDVAQRDATKWRWELGLVARANGAGAVGGRVRLVVCMKGVCVPRIMPFQGQIAVGE